MRLSSRGFISALTISSLGACTSLVPLDDSALPAPAPGMPGFDFAAGGSSSRSAHYWLVGNVGEASAGNVVGKSRSYTLNGGVIATTSE